MQQLACEAGPCRQRRWRCLKTLGQKHAARVKKNYQPKAMGDVVNGSRWAFHAT
jgi:hypothetical protein